MRRQWLFVCYLNALLLALPVHARQAQINGMRFWTDPENTRLVFDISEKPQYRVRMLKDPYRLLIDVRNVGLTKPLVQPQASHKLLSRVKSVVTNDNDLRIEVALKASAKPKSFTLEPNQIYGNRLVVDLYTGTDTDETLSTAAEEAAKFVKGSKNAKTENSEQANLKTAKRPLAKQSTAKTIYTRSKNIIVAIDAGHGGEDPGAHGPNGTEEKVVVLSIARKLERLLKDYPGIHPVMVRKGDYYVGLKKRVHIAHKARADLFVSIHADAFNDDSVRGASIYTLAPRGSSSDAARWLATSENAADIVGGVSGDEKDDVLTSVLMDLSQTATQEASQSVARRVLKNISKVSALHQDTVQRAGFVVLKSPDIPSILVETAYISNPSDEANLRSERYQTRVANAVFKGILEFFQKNPPSGTRIASGADIKPVDGALVASLDQE